MQNIPSTKPNGSEATLFKITFHTFLQFLSLAILLLTLIGIVYYHYWSISHICPIFDGNNCVARASNIGLFLAKNQFDAAFLKLQLEWNNFLSIIYFSIFSALIGPGRAAWGWGWAFACLALLASQIIILKTNIKWSQVILTFLLVLICSPILSSSGGLLDQRFDLIPLLLFLAAAASVYANRLMLGMYLSIAAIYAKGPAIPVFFIFWLSAFIAKMVTRQQIINCWKKYKLALFGCGIFFIIYKIWFFQTVVSYNLMAAKTSGHSLFSSAQAFIYVSFRNIIVSHFFYIKSLCTRSPFFLILFLWGTVILYQKRNLANDRQKHLLCWGFCIFIFTYLLFSSHPVHASVLDLWFLPAVWIVGFAISFQFKNNDFLYCFLLSVIIVKLFFTAYTLFSSGTDKSLTYQQDYQLMREQAHSIGRILGQRPQLSHKVIRLLPNFLYTPQAGICFAYDTYRVLIFEYLGKKSPILEGWELATYSDNWSNEINDQTHSDALLAMIVTGGQDKIHFRKKANKIAAEYLSQVNMTCELKPIQGATVPDMGLFRFFLTQNGLAQCY